jgi:cytochrome c-type biogenesis protein CcmH
MVERYGEFVLYRPPIRAATWLLWFGPPLLLVLGIVLLLRYVRSRRARIERAPLNDEERRAAQALLSGGEGEQR